MHTPGDDRKARMHRMHPKNARRPGCTRAGRAHESETRTPGWLVPKNAYRSPERVCKRQREKATAPRARRPDGLRKAAVQGNLHKAKRTTRSGAEPVLPAHEQGTTEGGVFHVKHAPTLASHLESACQHAPQPHPAPAALGAPRLHGATPPPIGAHPASVVRRPARRHASPPWCDASHVDAPRATACEASHRNRIAGRSRPPASSDSCTAGRTRPPVLRSNGPRRASMCDVIRPACGRRRSLRGGRSRACTRGVYASRTTLTRFEMSSAAFASGSAAMPPKGISATRR